MSRTPGKASAPSASQWDNGRAVGSAANGPQSAGEDDARARKRQRDADLVVSDELVRALAAVLDIREVFPQRVGDRAVGRCRTIA